MADGHDQKQTLDFEIACPRQTTMSIPQSYLWVTVVDRPVGVLALSSQRSNAVRHAGVALASSQAVLHGDGTFRGVLTFDGK